MKKQTPIKRDGIIRYVVSTVLVPFVGGYETMVFPATPEGAIRNYRDLDARTYASKEEAEQGHQVMCEKWGGEA